MARVDRRMRTGQQEAIAVAGQLQTRAGPADNDTGWNSVIRHERGDVCVGKPSIPRLNGY